MTYALIITVPMVFVWLIVVLDILVRQDLSAPWKVAWVAGVTVVWPSMILYLLLRPIHGRLLTATRVRRENPDRRQQLVAAALERRAGRMDESEFQAVTRQLRSGQ